MYALHRIKILFLFMSQKTYNLFLSLQLDSYMFVKQQKNVLLEVFGGFLPQDSRAFFAYFTERLRESCSKNKRR